MRWRRDSKRRPPLRFLAAFVLSLTFDGIFHYVAGECMIAHTENAVKSHAPAIFGRPGGLCPIYTGPYFVANNATIPNALECPTFINKIHTIIWRRCETHNAQSVRKSPQ
jgi:hypothetical protein